MSRLLSKMLAFGVLALLVVLLVAATLVDGIVGQGFAGDNIYSSFLFVALWGLLALSALVYIFKSPVRRVPASLFLHLSLVVVLVGAFVTYLTGERGSLFLRKEAAPSSMFVKGDGALVAFPFRVVLEDCRVLYGEDGAPLDYVAGLSVLSAGGKDEARLSMNRVYDRDGYRFYISEVTDDAVSLLVSHDPWGVPVTYSGYILVVIAFLFLFVARDTQWAALKHRLRAGDSAVESKIVSKRRLPVLVASLLLLGYITYKGICAWVETGLFPVSNGAEAMMFIAWCSLFPVPALLRRNVALASGVLCFAVVCAAAAILSGAATPGAVPPVLRTPLLPLHVAAIVSSYALIAFLAVNSLVALCAYRFTRNYEQLERAAVQGRMVLYFATFMLLVGIFLGAVWANISWGRYWGWDPKEVWALITLIVCSFGFHTRSLPFMARPLVFHCFCLVAFCVALFTYLGVNFLLGGLHSYA